MSSDPWYCVKLKVEGPNSHKNSQRTCKTLVIDLFWQELFEEFYGPRAYTENGVKKKGKAFCQ